MRVLLRGTFQRRLLTGLLLLSLTVSAMAALLLFWSFEESEREEAEAWMLATVIQIADRITSEQVEDALVTDWAREELRAVLNQSRQALIRELDAAVGEPVAEETIVNIAILTATDSEDRALVLVSLDPNEAGQSFDMSVSTERRLGWSSLSVDTSGSGGGSTEPFQAYVPIRDPSGVPIGVVRLDASRAYFRNLFWEALAGASLLFVVGVSLSLVSIWRITAVVSRPVEQLARSMDAVAAGDLDTQVAIPNTRDEFDELATHFNRMVSDLRERRRMKRDMDAAAEIQRHLLPVGQPAVHGYDVFGDIRYCDEAGGDYFDIFGVGAEERTEGADQVVLVVADVTGHGLRAALPMMGMRAVLRAAFRREGTTLVEAIRRVNEQVLSDASAGSFVTAFAATLDTTTHRLRWLNAGHEPALLLRGCSGELLRLDATGVPLGVAPDAATEGVELVLDVGDTLLVGTDGIRECRNAQGAFFGMERIEETLRAHTTSPAAQLWTTLIDHADSFRGETKAMDDQTLLIVKRISNGLRSDEESGDRAGTARGTSE